MTLFQNSRYRFGDTQKIQDADGNWNEYHKMRKTTVAPPVSSVAYEVKAGDTFEMLAFRFYDDADRWYVIADANPEIFWPLDLKAGTTILIPPASSLVTE